MAEKAILEARLRAFSEIHDYWEFEPGVTEETFDEWLHAEIRAVREQLKAITTRPGSVGTSNEPHAAVAEGQSYCDSAPRDPHPSSAPSRGVATEVRHEQ